MKMVDQRIFVYRNVVHSQCKKIVIERVWLSVIVYRIKKFWETSTEQE